MTPCVGFINSVLYVYKGPPLCTKTSGTLSEPDPAARSGAQASRAEARGIRRWTLRLEDLLVTNSDDYYIKSICPSGGHGRGHRLALQNRAAARHVPFNDELCVKRVPKIVPNNDCTTVPGFGNEAPKDSEL